MFEQNTPRTTFQSGVQHLELIYHSIVRDIRKSHGNAFLSILLNMLQAAMFVISFYVMFTILGLRSSAVRGDFLLYIMSGIFLFMTHTKTLGAVVASEGPASPMMKHAPMNTLVAIASAALGTLITVNNKVKEKGGQLRLSNIDPQIYEVFVITKLNKLFHIHEDISAAMASFQ